MKEEKIIENIWKEIAPYKPCEILQEGFTREQLAAAFRHSQGIEFITNNNLWNSKAMHFAGQLGLEEFGIYITEGNLDLKLENAEFLVLVGKVKAQLKYNGNNSGYVVVADRAHAQVEASDYSLVRIICGDLSSDYSYVRTGEAVILE